MRNMHGGHGGGGRRGRGGGWQVADLPPATDAAEWFAAAVPADWFVGPPTVTVDREEILVVGEVAGDNPVAAGQWRAATRHRRMEIAAAAQHRYGRAVSWGVRDPSGTHLFTHLAVPVMTRLRQPERQVLDTLVDAGVARSRADAVAWCVRLVGEHVDGWLGELRTAMQTVDEVRARGPRIDDDPS